MADLKHCRASAFAGYFGNIYQEKLYKRHQPTRGPEARLYTSMHGGLMFPGAPYVSQILREVQADPSDTPTAGLFIFAFTPGRAHWMGPIIGLFMVSAEGQMPIKR